MANKKKISNPVQFPSEVFVYHERGLSDEHIFYIAETTDEIEDGLKVGVYSLREVLTKRVYHELD